MRKRRSARPQQQPATRDFTPGAPFLSLDWATRQELAASAEPNLFNAVAELWGRNFTGFVAWLLWLGIHVAKLIGFRNRALVLVNWAWNYISYERAVRLILPFEPGEDVERDVPKPERPRGEVAIQ